MSWLTIALVAGLMGLPASQDVAEQAEAAFQAGEWEAAIEHFEALADAAALDSEGHFKLGYAHWRLGNCNEVLTAYSGARATHGENPRMLGTSAICAARLGRADEALRSLKAALAVGAPPGVLLGDPSFEKYENDARLAALVQEYDPQLRPCMHDELARQFDFWIGEWDVYSSGVVAGRNTITMEQNGCLLREEWVTGGGSGTSINFVDRQTGNWRQIWTNNTGGVTHYEGSLIDGAMRFEGTNVGIGGAAGPLRMTFSINDDGSVRQLIEGSTDGGATWTISFDGRYVRREES